jgi:tetratricopeptide (TPR) repeat protein
MSVWGDDERRVLPRWRDAATTGALGELDSAKVRASPVSADPKFFQDKLDTWAAEVDVAAASELAAAALILGREQEAVKAARFLLESPRTSEMGRRVAAAVVDRATDKAADPVSLYSEEPSNARIAQLRTSLREDPRNSLAWTDLALEYASIGVLSKAGDAIEMARRLAPSNRFVLRSAARFWIHASEPDRAHEILRRQAVSRIDPWLVATEISVAQVAGISPKFIREGRSLLNSEQIAPRHTSELASALATLELKAGGGRSARKLFAKSLLSPNDNSVAQATWAARLLPGLEVEQRALELPRTFEARAWKLYSDAMWGEVVAQCRNWLRDEPFSTKPAEIGSYVALVATGDFALGEQLAGLGLRANPDSPGLLNNMVVALVEQGRVTEGERILNSIRPKATLDPALEATLLATQGMVAFRKGDLARGRQLYRDAAALGAARKLTHVKLLAELHSLREEIIAGADDAVRTTVAFLAESALADAPDIRTLVGRVRKLLASVGSK